MKMEIKYLVLAACVGCGIPDPPKYFSIDSAFSEIQADAIREAESNWCNEINYCAEEVTWTQRGQFLLSFDYEKYERPSASQAFNCHSGEDCADGTIYVNANGNWVNSQSFSHIITHEIGHHGNEDHTKHGLMNAELSVDDPYPVTIDDDAIANWCDGVGC